MLWNSKRHIDLREAEVNMIKFTVQFTISTLTAGSLSTGGQ